MEKNPEIQFRSPEDIKSYQEEQLAKVPCSGISC